MANAQARYLGAELRRLRGDRGLSGEAVAARLQWSPSKVTRYERASTRQKPSEVDKLLHLYRLPADKGRELMDLARKLWDSTTWEEFPDVLAVEYDTACGLLEWALLAFPRVLQTEDYAMALLASTRPVLQTLRSEMTSSVQATLGWQARLTSPEQPLALRAVFDESVLYRRMGPGPLMKEQLEHVIELASQDGVHVRMLPYTAVGVAKAVPFTYVQYPDVNSRRVPDAVLLQTLHGSTLVDTEREVDHYALTWDSLHGAALTEEETLEAVRLACKAIYT